MAILSVEGKEFDLDSLSEEAKAHVNAISFTDTKIKQLESELMMSRAARTHYISELLQLLPVNKSASAATKASTTKASTTKASTTKASTTKASTAKASTAKASTRKKVEPKASEDNTSRAKTTRRKSGAAKNTAADLAE